MLPLAEHFLADVASSYEEPPKTLGARGGRLARTAYDWPGNVRELRNAIERAFLFCGDRTIQALHLPSEIRNFRPLTQEVDDATSFGQRRRKGPFRGWRMRSGLLIARVLKVTAGNQSDAARLLDVERHRLRRKIMLHGLEHLARIRPR